MELWALASPGPVGEDVLFLWYQQIKYKSSSRASRKTITAKTLSGHPGLTRDFLQHSQGEVLVSMSSDTSPVVMIWRTLWLGWIVKYMCFDVSLHHGKVRDIKYIFVCVTRVGIQWSPSNKDTPSAKQFCPY